jgi:hypothetical protein
MLRSLLNQVTVLASFSVDAADMESWNVLAAAINEKHKYYMRKHD